MYIFIFYFYSISGSKGNKLLSEVWKDFLLTILQEKIKFALD